VIGATEEPALRWSMPMTWKRSLSSSRGLIHGGRGMPGCWAHNLAADRIPPGASSSRGWPEPRTS